MLVVSAVNNSSVLGLLLVASLAGCASSSDTKGCPPSQALMVAGFSTGSTPLQDGLPDTQGPYSTSATFIYLSTNQDQLFHRGTALTVEGTPVVHGSDGTTISPGMIVPVETVHDDLPIVFGYSSSITGLKSNVTYSVSFSSLRGVQTGCAYGGEQAGSFTTS
jgi:hypothetical protein